MPRQRRKQKVRVSNEQIENSARNHLKDSVYFEVLTIECFNLRPDHLYTITDKHVAYAADQAGGKISDGVMRAFEDTEGKGMCGHRGCDLRIDAHHHDRVLMLKLKQDVPHEEAAREIMRLKPLLEKNNVEGTGFVSDNFKILPMEEDDE